MDELLASMGDEADVELQSEQDDIDLAELEKSADEAPIVKLVNIVMTDAVKRGASDIHIEPYEKEYRVRFRIDGVLQHIMSPPMKLKDAITSRIKIMAKMDISEKAPAARRPNHVENADRRRRKSSLIFASTACPRCGAKKL